LAQKRRDVGPVDVLDRMKGLIVPREILRSRRKRMWIAPDHQPVHPPRGIQDLPAKVDVSLKDGEAMRMVPNPPTRRYLNQNAVHAAVARAHQAEHTF
jgi:hypothetical protein